MKWKRETGRTERRKEVRGGGGLEKGEGLEKGGGLEREGGWRRGGVEMKRSRKTLTTTCVACI